MIFLQNARLSNPFNFTFHLEIFLSPFAFRLSPFTFPLF